MSALKIFTNGIVKENPLLVLSIGLCSSLAVTTSVFNGLGMGLSMTFVLLMSEIIISLFRKLIPSAIRLPIFIIVIAAFTTIVQLLLQAYLPALSDSLGVFIPLIVVNCIIMGRVEAFSSKNSVGLSILDALGMGLGYTWVLAAISLVRELLGSGKIFGHVVFAEENAIGFFNGAPGGFFVFGIMIAVTLGLSEMKKPKKEGADSKAQEKAEAAADSTGAKE
ncbi:MAG: electron transport complex subunit E [Treponema sp.]|nr:electron transport complex subunit E [Treponema sp.]